MRGAVTILHLLLLVVIAISALALMAPWASKIVEESMDATEINSIGPQFKSCSEKIIETARTGTTNKCIFSIGKGTITGKREGISYRLISTGEICDEQEMILIDDKSHIYQDCNVSGSQRIYEMLWMFPSQLKINGTDVEGMELKGETPVADISFIENPLQFKTLTLFVEFDYTPGESGNVVEISRKEIKENKIYLSIKIM
jgi:hypothetical protein